MLLNWPLMNSLRQISWRVRVSGSSVCLFLALVMFTVDYCNSVLRHRLAADDGYGIVTNAECRMLHVTPIIFNSICTGYRQSASASSINCIASSTHFYCQHPAYMTHTLYSLLVPTDCALAFGQQ